MHASSPPRAIVLAGPTPGRWPELSRRRSPSLLPLVDRPFLQHVVERIAALGIREVDLIVSDHPAETRELIGDGQRWGLSIQHHLCRDARDSLLRARALAARAGGRTVLLARGDRLPAWEAPDAGPPAVTGDVIASRWRPMSGQVAWTGWAWLPGTVLATLDANDMDGLEACLVREAAPDPGADSRAAPLAAEPLPQLLESQARVLGGEPFCLLLTGQEREPRVRLGRGAVVSPQARLVPPVFLGEDCRVGPGATVGPHASVGAGSVVDGGASVRNSVVLPGSYIGRDLWLEDVLVDRSLVVSFRQDAEARVDEDHLLGPLDGREPGRPPGRLTSRALALLGLAMGWPVLLALIAQRRFSGAQRTLARREVVATPGPFEPSGWARHELPALADLGQAEGLCGLRDMTHRLLPGLVSVAAGRLSLVGLRPREPRELEALPPHRRSLCLSTEAGLVTEAYVRHGPTPTAEEAHAAECIQATRTGALRDAALLLGYVRRIAADARQGEG